MKLYKSSTSYVIWGIFGFKRFSSLRCVGGGG